MRRRTWVRSGISEEFDARQQRLLDHVLDRVRCFYQEQYGRTTQQPLSLSRLMRLCRRSSVAVSLALRVLAHSVEDGESLPPLWYERIASARFAAKRYYRIWLRER